MPVYSLFAAKESVVWLLGPLPFGGCGAGPGFVPAGAHTQLFKKRSDGFKFPAKPAPIPSFQLSGRAVKVAEGFARAKVRREFGTSSSWRKWNRQGWGGSLEKGG